MILPKWGYGDKESRSLASLLDAKFKRATQIYFV